MRCLVKENKFYLLETGTRTVRRCALLSGRRNVIAVFALLLHCVVADN